MRHRESPFSVGLFMRGMPSPSRVILPGESFRILPGSDTFPSNNTLAQSWLAKAEHRGQSNAAACSRGEREVGAVMVLTIVPQERIRLRDEMTTAGSLPLDPLPCRHPHVAPSRRLTTHPRASDSTAGVASFFRAWATSRARPAATDVVSENDRLWHNWS